MTAPFHKTDHYSPAPQYTMPNTYLDKAIEAVPKLEERISFSNFVFLLRTSEESK